MDSQEIRIGTNGGRIYNLSDDKANPMLVIILDNGKIITSEKE